MLYLSNEAFSSESSFSIRSESVLLVQVAMMTALGLSNHSWMIFAIIVAFSPAHILIPATRTLMANQVIICNSCRVLDLRGWLD